jgi:hypothetical protein
LLAAATSTRSFSAYEAVEIDTCAARATSLSVTVRAAVASDMFPP